MRSTARGAVRCLLCISRTACAAMLLAPTLLAAATLTVTSTADTIAVDGAVTLREAIASVNAGANANADIVASGMYGVDDAIHFDIAGGCATACRITLASSLGTLAKPVIIDGYTQPGSSANTLAVGDNAAIRIEIDGDMLPGGVVLTLAGSDTTLSGLDLHGGGLGGAILDIDSGSNYTIEGNFIGTDATASNVNGAAERGAGLLVFASNVHIGGAAPGQRNVIAGLNAGIDVADGSSGVSIQGNYIGIDGSGNEPLETQVCIGVGAQAGVAIGDVTIGGISSGAGNVIAGCHAEGIIIQAIGSPIGSVLIQGNLIGTDSTGNVAIGNWADGIRATQDSLGVIGSLLIGGSAPGAGNVIAGNGTLLGQGIALAGLRNAVIQGNGVGVGVDGSNAIPNMGDGIRVDTTTVLVGGTNAGEGNTIANNRTGVAVVGASAATILGNSIIGNQALGIDLDDDLVTANDAGDADSGPNALQNYPLLTLASQLGMRVSLSGTLNSAPDTTYRVEFFSNQACSASGNGEGKTFLGFRNVTTDGAGNVTFGPLTLAVPATETIFTSTATDPSGNTSEFSTCLKSIAAPTLEATPTSIPTLSHRMAWILGSLLALVGGLAFRKR